MQKLKLCTANLLMCAGFYLFLLLDMLLGLSSTVAVDVPEAKDCVQIF